MRPRHRPGHLRVRLFLATNRCQLARSPSNWSFRRGSQPTWQHWSTWQSRIDEMSTANNRPFRRRARTSIRVMMLAILIVAVPPGWQVNRAREQREALDASVIGFLVDSRVSNGFEDQTSVGGCQPARIQCTRRSMHRDRRPGGERQPWRGPSASDQYAEPVVGPTKVLGPTLCSGIEERDLVTRVRVSSRGAVGFETIAQRAAQPEVRFVRWCRPWP